MIIKTIQDFLKINTYGVIINESTNQALLFIDPEFETYNDERVLVKFKSLSENQGSSIQAEEVLDYTTEHLKIGTDDNLFTIRPLNLDTYNLYIKNSYFNSGEIKDNKELFSLIQESLPGKN